MIKSKDIREAVEAELRFDPLVDDAGITVKNLTGDVALNGTVPGTWRRVPPHSASSA